MGQYFPPLRPESGHLLHLDALRLIASAGVITLHMSQIVDAGAWSERFVIATSSFILFVDMFFAVSGFVIAFIYLDKIKDARSYESFLRKRLARLVPLHWATLAIFVLIGIVLHSRHISINNPQHYEWRCLPTNFLLLHSTGLLCRDTSFNGVSWSISAEMLMYLMAPALFWVMRRNVTAIGVLAAGVWLALTLGTHDANSWYQWTAVGGFIRAIPSFMFGAWLFAVRQSVSRLPFAGAAFWLSVWGFLIGCCVGLPPIALMLTLYSAVAFGVAADAQGRRSRLVSTLAAGGQLTYSSYMLHILVITVLLNGVADRILHTHGIARNLLVLIAFAMVWPISYLSLVLFEKPARRWISGGKVKTPPS
jgi:peptidoglycan/LPS O-acetylase OafA/YrhL